MNAKAIKRAVINANPRERDQLRKEYGIPIANAQREQAEIAEEEFNAGMEVSRELHGPKVVRSSWKLPWAGVTVVALLFCGVLICVVIYFNGLTWQLPQWALGTVGIGLPLCIVASKVGGTISCLSDDASLRPGLEAARRSAKISGVALIGSGAGFALSKTNGQIPDSVSLAILAILEGALAFQAAAYICQSLILWRPGLHFRAASSAAANSHELEAAIAALEDTTLDEEPKGPSGPPSGNGRQPRGQSLIRGAFRSIVVLALVASSVSSLRASTLDVGLYLDKTSSVSRAELVEDANIVASAMADVLARRTDAIHVELVAFDGTPQSTRVATNHWDIDSLSVAPCRSPFPTRCAYLRQQAVLHMAQLRKPVFAEFIGGARALAMREMVCFETCLYSCLSDAQSDWRSVVITDGAANCDQIDASLRSGRDHVLLIVVARPGDGPRMQERLLARVAALRSMGYRVIDGRTIRHFDWEGFLGTGAR